jgi:tRNA A37 threonylcarbamoyladenosine biosynthesis protein TsaE
MKSIKIIEWEAIDENGSKEFAAGLKDYLIPGATFLLYGDLGSGKTFLVREVAAVCNK